MYFPWILLFFHFFFKTTPNLSFGCCISSCFESFFPFILFNSSIFFAPYLSIEFIFGCILSYSLKMFTSWSSLYFVLKHIAILIFSVLYATSACTCPLPPSFLFYYILPFTHGTPKHSISFGFTYQILLYVYPLSHTRIKVLVGKPEGNRILGSPRRRREDIIKEERRRERTGTSW
jgi:hypothetical protein